MCIHDQLRLEGLTQIPIVYMGTTGKRTTSHEFMDTTQELTVLMNKMSVMVKITERPGFEHMNEEKNSFKRSFVDASGYDMYKALVMSQNYNIYFLQSGEYFDRSTKKDPTKP